MFACSLLIGTTLACGAAAVCDREGLWDSKIPVTVTQLTPSEGQSVLLSFQIRPAVWWMERDSELTNAMPL